MTLVVLAMIAAFFLLAYFGAPLFVWTIAAAALLSALAVVAAFDFATNVALVAVFVALAAILNVAWLRRKLLTDRVLALYRRILPDMSQTEKEAIDAGTVWWDADLFSGRPDWDMLLAVRPPRLAPEEQAFLDGPVEELCAMCNDWQITHELQDLPPQVWQFIKDNGFLGMIIPKK
ncbi:MAG: acyl-CoA dehydrogenase, partial [Burkholderiales bacterium]